MADVQWFVQRPFHLPLVGGEDWEYAVGIYQIVRTSVDGKTTEIEKGPPFDFTGWTQFYAAMAPDGAPGVVKVLSLVIDGDPTTGQLRLYGRGVQTWDLQTQGYRAGDITLAGLAPSGQRKTVALGKWDLTPGLVGPSTPYIPNWQTIRA